MILLPEYKSLLQTQRDTEWGNSLSVRGSTGDLPLSINQSIREQCIVQTQV